MMLKTASKNIVPSSKRPGVGFGRELPNLAGAGNWPFLDFAGAGNFISSGPRLNFEELFTKV